MRDVLVVHGAYAQPARPEQAAAPDGGRGFPPRRLRLRAWRITCSGGAPTPPTEDDPGTYDS